MHGYACGFREVSSVVETVASGPNYQGPWPCRQFLSLGVKGEGSFEITTRVQDDLP